nr:MAG TPA: hypothetical protein [Caudoviricetes sp.]
MDLEILIMLLSNRLALYRIQLKTQLLLILTLF